MRASTVHEQQRLHLLASTIVARHYRRPLTLAAVARACSCSPRQVQRAYGRCANVTFGEQLVAIRMAAAADLLIGQPHIPIADVARLVGYRRATHFARAFRRRYGIPPARFREQGRSARANGIASA